MTDQKPAEIIKTDTPAQPGDDLTPMQHKFCIEYLVDLNGKEAAIRAGYSEDTAAQQAWNIRQKPSVQKFIEHLQEQTWKKSNVSAARVLHAFAEIAFNAGNKPNERQQALNSLARHFGLYNDSMRLSADGFVINIKK